MDVWEERLLGNWYTSTLHASRYLFRSQHGHFGPLTQTQLAQKVFKDPECLSHSWCCEILNSTMLLVLCHVRCSQPEATYCRQPMGVPLGWRMLQKPSCCCCCAFPQQIPISHVHVSAFHLVTAVTTKMSLQLSASIPGEHLVTWAADQCPGYQHGFYLPVGGSNN